MTNIEKVNKALSNADESKIKEVLDFLGYKESERFLPEPWKIYHYITSFGEIVTKTWSDDVSDNYKLSVGNVFGTREEAQFAMDKQIFETRAYWEFKDSSNQIEWDNDKQNKYYIDIDHEINSLAVDYECNYQWNGTLYSTNEEFVEQFLKDNEDNIKKFWFGNE